MLIFAKHDRRTRFCWSNDRPDDDSDSVILTRLDACDDENCEEPRYIYYKIVFSQMR